VVWTGRACHLTRGQYKAKSSDYKAKLSRCVKTLAGSRVKTPLRHAKNPEKERVKAVNVFNLERYGRLLTGLATNHFAGSGPIIGGQNIYIRGDVQRSKKGKFGNGSHVSAACPTSLWLVPLGTQQQHQDDHHSHPTCRPKRAGSAAAGITGDWYSRRLLAVPPHLPQQRHIQAPLLH
jgi:hypothetical protein